MKAKAMVVTARPPSPFAYESVASARERTRRAPESERVRPKEDHSYAPLFSRLFPRPADGGSRPIQRTKGRLSRSLEGQKATRASDRGGAEEGGMGALWLYIERPREK